MNTLPSGWGRGFNYGCDTKVNETSDDDYGMGSFDILLDGYMGIAS